MVNVWFVLIALVISGCEPGSFSRRVKPDKVSIVGDREADVYLSKDRKVEFQVLESGAIGGSPPPRIIAVIVNNRETSIQIDLSSATFQLPGKDKLYPATGDWHEGCGTSYPKPCDSSIIRIQPGKPMHVSWEHGALGEFHLPIINEDKTTEIIVARFESCSSFLGPCETKR